MNHRVVWLETGQSFEVAAGEAVLEAALRRQSQLPTNAQSGGCGTCRVRLVEGAIGYEETPMGLTPEEAEAGYALACQARCVTDLVIRPGRCRGSRAQRAERDGGSGMRPAPRCDPPQLRCPISTASVYLPGQHERPAGRRPAPQFLDGLAPIGNRVDLHVRRIPGGRFTDGRTLAPVCAGSRARRRTAAGRLPCTAKDFRPLLMVATGTGLAPIKSILESLMDDDDCPPVALLGHAHRSRPLPPRRHRAWAERLSEFEYVRCSRAPAPLGRPARLRPGRRAGRSSRPVRAFDLPVRLAGP